MGIGGSRERSCSADAARASGPFIPGRMEGRRFGPGHATSQPARAPGRAVRRGQKSQLCPLNTKLLFRPLSGLWKRKKHFTRISDPRRLFSFPVRHGNGRTEQPCRSKLKLQSVVGTSVSIAA